MMKLAYDPPMPTVRPPGAFVQSIALLDGERPVATARWMAMNEGVAQLLELSVDAEQRRAGLGQRMVHAVAAQARDYFKLDRQPLRRVWMGVEQKSQVVARAFLTHLGFHHIATVRDLYTDQDLLIYSKAFD